MACVFKYMWTVLNYFFFRYYITPHTAKFNHFSNIYEVYFQVFPTTYTRGELHILHTVCNISKYMDIYGCYSASEQPKLCFMISFQRKLKEKHESFNVFKCVTCLSVDFPSHTTHIKHFQSLYPNSKLLSNLENTTLNLSFPPQSSCCEHRFHKI